MRGLEPDNERRALLEAIGDKEQLQRELMAKIDGRSILLFLLSARSRAVIALDKLSTVLPTDTDAVLLLQNEVRRYKDMLRWMDEVMIEGEQAWSQLDDRDQTELRVHFDAENQEIDDT